MHHASHFTPAEIEQRLRSLVQNGNFLLPSNKALFSVRKGDKIILKGYLFTTKIKLSKAGELTHLEIRTRFNGFFYLTLAFLVIFFSAFLFSDKVTLNGNSDPTFLEKLGFVTIGLALCSISLAIAIKLKSKFVQQIENKIMLHDNYS